MAKRIFTKVLSGTRGVVTTGVIPEGAVASWLAQEDIEVIGAEIAVVSDKPSENDGFAWCQIELSQVGIWSQDGLILKASASEGWNTTPAGVDQTNGHAIVAFPQGFAVSVKEEGYLYINTIGCGKTAGESTFYWSCIIYYTKRGA